MQYKLNSDPAIPVLEPPLATDTLVKTGKEIGIRLFISELFVIAKHWKFDPNIYQQGTSQSNHDSSTNGAFCCWKKRCALSVQVYNEMKKRHRKWRKACTEGL